MVFLVLRVQVIFLGRAVSYHHLFPAFVIVEPTGTRYDDGKRYKVLTLHISISNQNTFLTSMVKGKEKKFATYLELRFKDNIASIPRSTPRTYYLIQVI